ncbi:helix-turn-helix transcriptional regulator [Candidatus Woesebacteria bacterium]|nr:helix-turn-helix transcriptional regulator [Candidatus Woesebacteria bacterium]
MKNISPNKRKHLDARVVFAEFMKDPEFKREYEKVRQENEPIRAIIRARMEKGVTQASIAKKMGTTQSSIARVESGKSHPTIPFMQRLADALDMRLEVKFLPR